MALPLSTPGSCCGHNLNLHDRVRANGVATSPCLVCSCPDFVADTPGQQVQDAVAKLDARETQVGGKHYAKHRIQPWDIAIEYNLSYIEGSALKYLLRRKGSRLEDLKKARHCLDRLIELEEERGVLREETKEAW